MATETQHFHDDVQHIKTVFNSGRRATRRGGFLMILMSLKTGRASNFHDCIYVVLALGPLDLDIKPAYDAPLASVMKDATFKIAKQSQKLHVLVLAA